MKIENNLVFVGFQDLQSSSAEFQQYTERFQIESQLHQDTRASYICRTVDFKKPPGTFTTPAASLWARLFRQPRESQFWAGISLWPVSAQKDCFQSPGSTAKFKKLACPRWGGKAVPNLPCAPHHCGLFGFVLVFFLTGFKFIPRNFTAASWAVSPAIPIRLFSHKTLISSKIYQYNKV